MLLTIFSLRQVNSFDTIKPIRSKKAAIHIIPTPTTKIQIMRFVGSMNFHWKFIGKPHANMKLLRDLLHDNIKSQWSVQLEHCFNKLKHLLQKMLP